MKKNEFVKKQQRTEQFDEIISEFKNNINYSVTYNDDSTIDFLAELINQTVHRINGMLAPTKIHLLSENEQKVGHALIELLSNWDDIFDNQGSNKFLKSEILYFLREATLLSTTEIRNGMRKYKVGYYDIKKKMIK
jgi:hypothetical protein